MLKFIKRFLEVEKNQRAEAEVQRKKMNESLPWHMQMPAGPKAVPPAYFIVLALSGGLVLGVYLLLKLLK